MDLWEQLRHMTLDQLITAVKLRGSAAEINGTTTPEGWPFRVAVAIGSPGNESGIELLDEFSKKMVAAASFSARIDRDPKAGG